MERAFEVKSKTFSQVSQVLFFKLEKQTSKHVVDPTFDEYVFCNQYYMEYDHHLKFVDPYFRNVLL